MNFSKDSLKTMYKIARSRVFDFEYLMRFNNEQEKEERLKNDVEYLSLKNLLRELDEVLLDNKEK